MELKTIAAVLEHAGVITTEEQMSFLSQHLVLKTSVPKKDGKTFYHRSSKFGPKTPLQMRQCVLVLHDLGSATLEDWALMAGDVLETRQDPAKIIAYYRKRMLDEGLVSLTPPVEEQEPTNEDASEPVVDDETAGSEDTSDEPAQDVVVDVPEIVVDEQIDHEIQQAVDEAMEEIG